VHSETQTFDREQAANIWMGTREHELAQPGALTKAPDPLLADVIDQYNRQKQKTHGKTKTQVLNSIKESDLAKKRCTEIGSPELVAYAQTLKAFTRACALLGIDDLHFHDLRHEGISRLFELGWTIPQVATVSSHRSWTSLKRYSHLHRTGDKYAGWPWIAKVLEAHSKPVSK
jgi:integrase